MFTVLRPSFEVVKEGRISRKYQTLGRPIEGVFLLGSSPDNLNASIRNLNASRFRDPDRSIRRIKK